MEKEKIERDNREKMERENGGRVMEKNNREREWRESEIGERETCLLVLVDVLIFLKKKKFIV